VTPSSQAWNPDYAYGLPKQRRMCVKRDGPNTLTFTSIQSDEDCPPTLGRYIVVFAREPKGAIGMVKSSTSLRVFPPLVLSWPANNEESGSPLWHFTCVKAEEMPVLDSKVSLMRYRGEITSRGGRTDCSSAEKNALKYCQDQWKGESLLETCPMSWGAQ